MAIPTSKGSKNLETMRDMLNGPHKDPYGLETPMQYPGQKEPTPREEDLAIDDLLSQHDLVLVLRECDPNVAEHILVGMANSDNLRKRLYAVCHRLTPDSCIVMMQDDPAKVVRDAASARVQGISNRSHAEQEQPNGAD